MSEENTMNRSFSVTRPICTAALSLSITSAVSLVAACGGSAPPPKTEAAVKEEPKAPKSGGGPTIEQELGSIDERAVERKFSDLQAKLETCHTKGRDHVEYLAGDVKVFL